MSNFQGFAIGARREEVVFNNLVLTGIAKLQPIVINPNLAQLQQMGYNFTEEPKYINQVDRTVNNVTTKVNVTTLAIYCKVVPVEGSTLVLPENFYIRVNFNVGNRSVKSTANKMEVINAYGQSIFVDNAELATLQQGQAVSLKPWFKPTGFRAAFEGEVEFIEFTKAFRNMPAINEKTPDSALEAVGFTPESFMQIINLDPGAIKYFNDFFTEKDEEGNGYTVAMALGARTDDKGNIRQDIYTKTTFRSYVANKPNSSTSAYLKKDIADSQANRHKTNTDFQLNDLTLKEYNASSMPAQANKEGLFGNDAFANLGMPADPLANIGQQMAQTTAAPAQQMGQPAMQQQAPVQQFSQTQQVPQQQMQQMAQQMPQAPVDPLASLGQMGNAAVPQTQQGVPNMQQQPVNDIQQMGQQMANIGQQQPTQTLDDMLN